MKKITLILIIIATFIIADFNRTSYGTVIDNSTGLEWQDISMPTPSDWNLSTTVCEEILIYDFSRNNPYTGTPPLYIRDWRLPNQLELLSIVDYTKVTPAIPSEFTDINNSIYWSSTTSTHNTNKAWSVDFSTGGTRKVDKNASYNIRCVKGGYLPIL